ncbi:MAG: hypothetical protein HFH90_16055 [Lachnospiraceae bacterium]|jgi:predicted DNA-binding protein|nr:hypothetical protein [Lachnospiraceae bacterium]
MNKNKTISLRVTKEEYDRINSLAQQNNCTMSDYIARQSLPKSGSSDMDLTIVPHIRTLLSKLEYKLLSKKDYIKEMRRLLNG